MKKLLQTVIATACTAGLLLAGNASAEPIRERTLRFAFQNAKEHPQGLGAQKFADLLSAKSGGKLKVRLYPGGALGGDLQSISALQNGALDLTVLNSGILAAQVPEFALFDFPYLFDDIREVHAVVDGPVGQQLTTRLEAKGLIGLGYWDLGFRSLTNNQRPITRWEDLQGLKMRVTQSPIYLETFNALGARPVPMPFPEVRTALAQGTVDGGDNAFTVIQGKRFDQVQKYLSVTNHVYNPQSLVLGQKSWQKLNADEQTLIREAAREAQAYQRQITAQSQAQAYEALKASMQTNVIAPAEIARFREKVKPVVEQFARELDQDVVRELYGAIDQVRAGR